MDPKLPDDGPAQETGLANASPANQRTTFAWPWGLVAIGFMALAWVGVYLVWNGFAFLLNW